MSNPRVVFKATNFERPLVTVDVVIFTVIADQLRVLLVRRPEGEQPLPGALELPAVCGRGPRRLMLACAERKLRTRPAWQRLPEQLGSWGDARRDPRGWSTTRLLR
jgi:8-oxo-dGTP diphosphatase